MKRLLLALLVGVALAACGEDASGGTTESSTTTTTSTTTSTTATTTTTAPPTTTTTVPGEVPEIAWTGADAERHVSNFLAALAAGAYEQAAASAEGNGIALRESPDDLPTDVFRRLCADNACAGPYTVAAQGPGVVDPITAQASSVVTVTHVDTGEKKDFMLATFEGQLIIADLPPLIPSSGGPRLVEALFGSEIPERVVVQRFNAFEIWEQGEVEWVTNWWADTTYQVEGDVIASYRAIAALRDPQQRFAGECGRLLSRPGEVLVLDQCDTSGWDLFEAESGNPRQAPVPFREPVDGGYAWFTERGGIVVQGSGDAEGNLFPLTTSTGVDLLGDDYAGYVALSTGGEYFAYVDHSDPAALSHFWSPVVVVKDTRTGDEIDRWVLDSPILCLEFAQRWVVACETDGSMEGLVSGMPAQQALVAINVVTGEINRVETRTRLFLPV